MKLAIPIIKYTHIHSLKDEESVGVDIFEKQIAYLVKKKYNFLTLSEYHKLKIAPKNITNITNIEDLEELGKLREHHVMLIFEGAWRDFYQNAFPILQKYKAKANIFIATEWVLEAKAQEEEAKKRGEEIPFKTLTHNACLESITSDARAIVCTWEELKKTKKICEFGSISHTYGLNNFVLKPWHEDVALSVKLIKENLGFKTTHFLWPRNEWSKNNERSAMKLGFNMFYLEKRGLNLLEDESSQALSKNGELHSLNAQNFYFKASPSLWKFRLQVIGHSSKLGFKLFG